MLKFQLLNIAYQINQPTNQPTNQLYGAESFLWSTEPLSQEIPRLFWNPRVHYCVHNNPPLVPILSQMHPVHTLPPYLPKNPSNIILSSTLRSSKWSLSFRFSYRNFIRICRAWYMSRPSHSPWFDRPNNF